MRRNVVFDRGRGFRAEDDEVRSLHLGPDRGAAIGEYASPEPGEYSDSYYGPGDAYARRSMPGSGYTRDQRQSRRDSSLEAGVVGYGASSGTPGYFGRGVMREGDRSWADVGARSVAPGQSGVTERSFRGRGPKGYRRSDERLREMICERLTEDPWLDASDIDVQVKDGEVTLEGFVRERASKWRDEDLVESCTGGALVHNRLRTKR